MIDNMNKYLKDFLEIESGSQLEIVYDGTMDIAATATPILGSIYNAYKFYRIEKRFDEINQRFYMLESELREQPKEVYDFVKYKTFPVVMENIFKEQQDEKVSYIINGFESVVRHHLTDEDLTYVFFDVLKEIRMAELKLLMVLTQENKPLVDENIQVMTKYVVNKLDKLGLINIVYTWNDLGGNDTPVELDRVHLSNFGKQFIEFFRANQFEIDA